MSLTVAPGKVTAVVGFSGSGKSTLMCLLQRFYDVDEGCISLDGHDIRSLDPSWLRTVIAAVLQGWFQHLRIGGLWLGLGSRAAADSFPRACPFRHIY